MKCLSLSIPTFIVILILSLLLSLLPSLSFSNPDLPTLLAFKSSADHTNSLSSWSDSSDPCSPPWPGVTCNPSTRRVTRLVLEELNLTGSIQVLSGLIHLRLLSLKRNRLSAASPPPLNLSSWPRLKHLYLSHNRFAGDFPAGVASLRRLHRLDLSHNYFTGEIPMTELTQLPHLITLRLEDNSFSGTLNTSSSSSSFSFASDFNVSGNKLVGEIPHSLSSLPESSFAGNENLCGKPLRYDCPNPMAEDGPVRTTVSGQIPRKNKLRNRVVLIIIGVDVVAAMATIAAVTWWCYKRRGKQREGKGFDRAREREDKMVFFEGSKGFGNVDDLLTASAEMLGKGGVGSTYKVVTDGRDVVAVKRVTEWGRRRKEVDGLLRVIGGLRHCNVVSLRAFYPSQDELLLVYDFLPNGSLHYLLHGNRGPGRTPLEWTTRLNLACGSAQGLAFLHSHAKPYKLVHGRLTSSNILIDHLGNPCISDIGLHRLSSSPNQSYTAPELINPTPKLQKFSQKCDVYSFGIVLLEIITGKTPSGEGETSLPRWVRRAAQEKSMWEVFDFELFRYKDMMEEMEALLQVALLCSNPDPADRPKMHTVHKMIEDIKSGSITNSPLNDIDLSSDSSEIPSESTPNFSS
ncbi:probable leucine-rich repeat receptor-like protein kinase At1g68400 [Malania oleifera]|uniref:probable leucine-rich repeat receptor-like protein kinase At1g68400 n=1 Tax=Malania oleifera TaxID=397392 RepID=UPI0025AE46FF|nr:probable leucine-rich repeat receptor-like protein kinase At1g68400 [Malania oleifera]